MPQQLLKPVFLTSKPLQPEYPLFIYLPGLDGTGQLLQSQTVALENHFDVRCLAIPADDLSNWDGLTNNVLNLVDTELEKSPQRPVYLCGESFGGCLAQQVAIAAPHLFQRIILVNPASSFANRHLLSWASQLMEYVPDCFFEIGAVGLLPFLASLGRIADGDRQALLKVMRSVPPATINWRLSLLREFKVDKVNLRRLHQPVLVIAGGCDRLLPSTTEAERLVETLPNSKMVILPDSGHACLLEKDINIYKIMQTHNFLECDWQILKQQLISTTI
ncbi:MAG: alpha/beta hydrolase [Nostocaceae cyanobacterium]|nr:alpha/beta hydrolase [Nostocaceae cyanobacterium]